MGEGGVALLRVAPAAVQALRERGLPPSSAAVAGQGGVVVAPAGASLANGVQDPATTSYSLQGVYFNAKQFSSVADCLTAASAGSLPLDLCR
jgi:hypothetical protein